MKRNRLWILLLAFGAVVLSLVFLLHFVSRDVILHSTVSYSEDQTADSTESIPDAAVPLAAPTTEESPLELIDISNQLQPENETSRASYLPTTQWNGSSEPITVEPVVSVSAPQEPAPQQPVDPEPPKEEPATPEEPQVPEEPQTPSTPVKAVKPSDITDVKSMAKYLYEAGTEFWAVEKDFCGTTTRPVSTRVASAIGGGTAVDCPGGDTVRIDKNGVAYDSYAIADHFRDYVDMPDLQYFKLYLSDKDYTVDPYGAREEVIGSFYQYGSQKATYEPEDQSQEESVSNPS